MVIVEGEAGLGKTALVREFRDRVAGFTKVTAACDPLATDESGWMLRQLVGGTPSDGAFAAGLDLLEWLGERQADGPVLLIVEDLHWCDPLSIGALVTALRRLDTDRLMAVITVRPGEIDAHTWHRLLDDPERTKRMRLGPISAADVTAMAEFAGVELSRREAEAVRAHAGGNPLHVVVLLRELKPEQLKGPGPLPAPATIARSTTEAMARVSPDAAEMAAALAVLGGTSDLIELSAIAPVEDPTAALDELLGTGFVERTELDGAPAARYVHPVHSSAVYDGLSSGTRKRLHLSASTWFGDPSIALAHRVAAADRSDDVLAGDLEAAAVGNRDAVQAARQLAAASRLTSDAKNSDRRLFAAGNLLLEHHHLGLLERMSAEIAVRTPSVDRDVLLGMGRRFVGDVAGAEELLLAALPMAAPGPERSRVLQYLTVIKLSDGVAAPALELATEALEQLRHAEPPVGIAEQAAAFSLYVGAAAHVHSAVHGLRLIAERYPDPWDADVPCEMHLARGIIAAHAGRPNEALIHLDATVEFLRHGELAVVLGGRLPQVHALRSLQHLRLGAWDGAALEAHVAVDLARDGVQRWVLPQALAVSALVAACRGDVAEADRTLASAQRALAEHTDADATVAIALARAARARAIGAFDQQARELSPVVEALDSLPLAHDLGCWLQLVGALLDAGRLEEAARQLDALAAHANASEVRIAQAMHSLRGRLAAARGDDDGALAAFERAIAAADVDDDRLERAGLHRAFGRFFRAIGRRRESVEQLAEARRLAAGMGASWLVLLLDDDLGAASALSSPGSSSGPAAKLGGLTERERDVVMLVVEGRTNKEVAAAMYVSTKAVEYHLGNVYAKLAISSRRELRHLVDAT